MCNNFCYLFIPSRQEWRTGSCVTARDTQYNGMGNSAFFTDFRFRAWTMAPRGGK